MEKREAQIETDKQNARQAREDAQALKQELDARLAQISGEAAQKMAQAVAAGQAQKEQLLAQAQEQAQRLLDQAKEQIQAEKNKALADVRSEIVNISLLAASRVLESQVQGDQAAQVVDRVLEEINAK